MNYESSHNGKQFGEHEQERISKVLESLKSDFLGLKIEETPDILYIILPPNEEKPERRIGFTKIGNTMMVNGLTHPQHFSDVVEATIRYPNIPLSESIESLKKYREEKLQNK